MITVEVGVGKADGILYCCGDSEVEGWVVVGSGGCGSNFGLGLPI